MPYKITENDVNYCTALCYKFHARYGRIPDEDQIQDCLEFMCVAAKKYTPELSPKFMTYARWWILRAVQKEYVSIHGNGYVINNDVYYQRVQLQSEIDWIQDDRLLDVAYEVHELAERLVGTMPPEVEAGFRGIADGKYLTDVMEEIGYTKSRQNLHAKIDRWRIKQGIKKGERPID